jgi:putative Mn2+ efflux pump MntP
LLCTPAVLLKLLLIVLPLGIDTFVVAAALAIAGLPPKERLRVSALFTLFEGGMPLVGLAIGAVLGNVLGTAADVVAIAALVLLGGFMLWPREESGEEARVALLSKTRGVAVVALGLSISLDELAIGFTLGLLRLPTALVVVLIALQAFVVTQLGTRFGARLGEAVREGAERVAGAILVFLGIILFLEKAPHLG